MAISYKELAEKAGISPAYATQLLSDKPDQKRTPSRSLAIHIFRKTGWRHDSIADLTEEQMTVLEAVDPWIAPKDRANAA